jgi:subtilase family serine protease
VGAALAPPSSTPSIGHLTIGQDPTPAASASPSATKPIASPTATYPNAKHSSPRSPAKGSPKPSVAPTASVPGPVAPVLVPAGWSTTGTDIGALPGSTALRVTFTLQSRDAQGLQAFVGAVSDPASPLYRRYLSNTDYAARFGPDATLRDQFASYLASAGLTVAMKTQDYVTVTGSADRVQQALRVSLHNYRVGSEVHFAPSGAITLPAALAAATLTVRGLDDTPGDARPASAHAGAFSAASPTGLPNCTQGYGQDSGQPKLNGTAVDFAPCPYDFQAIRAAYGIPATGLDGRGVTVGIVDVYNPPTLFNDASVYARTHGWPGFSPLQFTVVDDPAGYSGTCGGGPDGWYGEATMDVQAVHAMAPMANVVYGAAGCDQSGADLGGMLDYLISNHLVDLVTDSWSVDLELAAKNLNEQAAFDTLFQQAAAKGIGVYFASGDCGDYNNSCGAGSLAPCPPAPALPTPECQQHVDVVYPASSPYVTAVGGTSLALDPTGKKLFNAPWSDVHYQGTGPTWNPLGFAGGSGGGVSTAYARPAWQPGNSPDRLVPDIAMDASPFTSMAFGAHLTNGQPDPNGTYAETTEGGTSLSTPLFAGLQALVQQRLGSPLGFANPRLYQLAGTPAIDDVLQNVQNGGPMTMGWPNGTASIGIAEVPTGATACGTGANAAGCKGYDTVTGIGSPSTSYISGY